MLWLKEKHYSCYNSLNPLANSHYDFSSVMSYNSLDPLPIILTSFPQLIAKKSRREISQCSQLLSYIFFAPILSIQQYPIVLAKLEWLMMAQNPPGPDLHIFVWLLPYVPRSKQDIYSVCNSTFPDSKETFLMEVNSPPPCLTISCRQGFSHPLPKPR